MIKSKWIFFLLFSALSLSLSPSSYEASQVGVSKERLDKISPVLEENIKNDHRNDVKHSNRLEQVKVEMLIVRN